jgi:pyridoxal phosphate enzyme (YggS family)
VNISGEDSKSGVAPDALPLLAEQVVALPRLRLRGLMAIPAATNEEALQRAAFARLRSAFELLNNALGRSGSQPVMDTLSMGMSGDLEAAIAEGSTLVRVGTDIFGARNQPGR